MTSSVAYPLINGLRYDFSSVEVSIDGIIQTGFKELSYKDSLEPGEVYGEFAQSLGATRGQYKAEASATMYQVEAQEFIDSLSDFDGTGYMETYFTVTANYAETGQPTITIKLLACRVKSVDDSQKSGSDANETKFDFRVGMIVRNGKYPVSMVLK